MHRYLLLIHAFPEQHVRVSGDSKQAYGAVTRSHFSFLKLEIICHDDVGNECLYFVDRKKASWTEGRA
jgi:hypothetical protein